MNKFNEYPEVLAFAESLMLREMIANGGKGRSWKQEDAIALAVRVCEEANELLRAVVHGFGPNEIGKEAADVANVAMMVADVSGSFLTFEADKDRGLKLMAREPTKEMEKAMREYTEWTSAAFWAAWDAAPSRCGFKLLSEESTREMDEAGQQLEREHEAPAPWDIWTAMWRAAPSWPRAKP